MLVTMNDIKELAGAVSAVTGAALLVRRLFSRRRKGPSNRRGRR